MAKNGLGISPRVEMRRSTRIVRAVPMRVTGVDLLGQPFWERTATLDVNSYGCRYPSRQKVKTNSWLTLELADRGANRLLQSVQARVVWVGPPNARQEYFHIGVELEVSGNIWGIALPPGDWSPSRKPSPVQISTSVAGPPAMAQAPLTPASLSEAEPGELFHLEAGASPVQPRAWLVSEVQQQNHKMVPEATAAAVAAEASRLLDELRTQLQDEAKRIIEGMAAPHSDQWLPQGAQKPYEAQHAGAKSFHEQWARKIDLALREVSDQPAASTTERVQRILETSQRDLAARFVSQLQQQFASPLEQPQEVLTNLAAPKSPRRILRRRPAILAQAVDSAWTLGAQAMFCIKCGAENSGEAEFCWKCGKSIFTAKSEEVPSAAISLPPAPVTHSRAQPQQKNAPLPQGSTESTPGEEDLTQSGGPTHSPGTSGRIAGLQGTRVQAFVRTYQRMTSDQLLAVAKDLSCLSETAWTAGNQAMFCIKCGAENSEEAESCWKCGKSIFTAKSEEVPSAAISLPPAPVTHSRAQPQQKNAPLPQGSTESTPGEEDLTQSGGPTHSPGNSGRITGLQGTNVQAFVRTYQRMTSNQLLALAKDLSSLSETARNSLVVELRRRGLRAGQPQASKPKRHYKRVGGWLARFLLGSIGFSPILTVMRLVL